MQVDLLLYTGKTNSRSLELAIVGQSVYFFLNVHLSDFHAPCLFSPPGSGDGSRRSQLTSVDPFWGDDLWLWCFTYFNAVVMLWHFVAIKPTFVSMIILGPIFGN